VYKKIINIGSVVFNYLAMSLVLGWFVGETNFNHNQQMTTTHRPTLTVEEIEGLLKLDDDELTAYLNLAGWPEELQEEAMKVIFCESGGDVYAENKETKDYGLFQVNYGWHKEKVISREALFSPSTNVSVALKIYKRRGWLPWKASNPCHHLLG